MPQAHAEDGTRLWSLPFVLSILSAFAFFCSFYLALAALPKYLRDELGRNTAEIGIILGIFSIAAIVFRPRIGRIVNVGVVFAPMLIATVIFTTANALYVVATAIPLLILLRLFHGTGMACYTTAAPPFVAMLAPAHRRGEAMGFWGMANTLSLAVAPAFGLTIAARRDYRTMFVVSAVIGVVAVLTTALLFPFRPARMVNPPPAARTWVERPVLLPAMAVLAMTFSYGVIITFIPLLADERHIAAGSFFPVYAAALVVARVVGGRLSDRYGRWVVIFPGLVSMAAGLVVGAVAHSLLALSVVAILEGLGFGSAQPALLALVVDLVPTERRGSAVATYYMAHELGIAIGSIALGFVAEALTLGGMYAVAGVAVGVAVVGVALGVRRQARGRKGGETGSGFAVRGSEISP
jgi:MFS family permease